MRTAFPFAAALLLFAGGHAVAQGAPPARDTTFTASHLAAASTLLFASAEAKRLFARAWAEELSEEDLLALAAFYRSPLGLRAAAGQAALARKGAEIGRQLGSVREAELQQRLMERVAELEGAPEPQ